MHKGIVVVLLCTFSMHSISAELFSSMADFLNVVGAEKQITHELRGYINKEFERLKKLQSIADEYERHADEVMRDSGKPLSHPVNAYLLTKKFTTDWEEVTYLLNNEQIAEEFNARVNELQDSLPSEDDRIGSATALLRLQDTYKLDTRSIAQGNFVPTSSSPVLNARECFEIGKIAYESRDYYHTVLWMQEALERDTRERNKTSSRADILDYLAFSTSQMGNTRHALRLTNELLQLVPDHDRASRNKMYYEKTLENEKEDRRKRGDDGSIEGETIKLERSTDDYHKSEEFLRYEALCRGEKVVENPYEHELVCRYYDNNKHPFLRLGPVQMEELYLSPWIVMFHDIISEREMAQIRELAYPRLNRATVQNPQTGKLETAFYRVSKSAWLRDDESALVRRLSDRMEAITGINQRTSEELQVANYGLGGQYEPHFDHSRPEEAGSFPPSEGNRIATWLYYMSDVEAGGATAFIRLGLSVFPKKGAATFWYNLYRNGDGDWRTRHAGCPVLAGNKWVSNKWMHERGQEFTRPCSLNPEE